jgi:hypothetical protein
VWTTHIHIGNEMIPTPMVYSIIYVIDISLEKY